MASRLLTALLPATPRSGHADQHDYVALGLVAHGLNVRDFDAQGDGATDDTAAIQAAIDALPASGGIIFFPQGVYLIKDTLTVPSFCTLRGVFTPYRTVEITGGDPSGAGGSVIKCGGTADFDMVTNADHVLGNTTMRFEGLRFEQGAATGDVDILQLDKCWRTTVANCYFKGAATTNRRGVHILNASEQVTVKFCNLEGCGIAATGQNNAISILNNEIGAGNPCIELGGSGGVSYFHRVLNNHLYNAISSHGILASRLQEAVIAFNSIEHHYLHGLYVSRGMVYSVIANNLVKNNGQASSGTLSGIVIDSDTAASPSHHNVISGNACFDDQGSPSQKYGIYLDSFSGTQTNDNAVHGNTFANNTTAGFAQKAGLSNRVHDNVGYATEASGSSSIASGDTTKTIAHGLAVTPAAKDISITFGEQGTSDYGRWWLSGIDATNFVLNVSADPGASGLDFGWSVRVLP